MEMSTEIMENTEMMEKKQMNIIKPTIANFGAHSNIFNYGAQAEDISNIKTILSEMHTGVQEGNIEKDKLCETIEQLEKKIDHLLAKVESLEAVIKGYGLKMDEQQRTIDTQKSLIEQLKKAKQNLESQTQDEEQSLELQIEDEREKTMKPEGRRGRYCCCRTTIFPSA